MPSQFNLRRLFSLTKVEESTAIEDSNLQKNANQENAKREGETYKQYGCRLAGLSAASQHTLVPTLHAVYNGIKREQQKNADLQKQLRQRQETEINNKEAQKIKTENDLEATRKKIEEYKEEVEKIQKNIDGLKNETYRRNRPAWIQLIISGVLLIPFTVYFFIFYSSVGYSAFFQSFNAENAGEVTLSQAIFDSQAISKAWSDGFFEVLFMLLMPFIFLAFGFILNRWEREKGKLKYLKIPALIIVAFIFDMLLAYLVSNKLYEYEKLMTTKNMPPYSWGMAFGEPNFWVIIFLGFVAYLIWGFTFGFFIKALDDLDMNKIELQNNEQKLEELKQDIDKQVGKENSLRNAIAGLDSEIQNLRLNLNNYVRFDLPQIKLELNNFFAGWTQYMAVLEKSQQEMDSANTIFRQAMVSFKLDLDSSFQES